MGKHSYFERNDGNLEKAVTNANRSMDEKKEWQRLYLF